MDEPQAMPGTQQVAVPPGPRFSRLVRLIRPYGTSLVLGCALLALESAIGLVALRQAGLVVDSAQTGSTADLHRTSLLLLALFAGIGLLVFCQHWILETAGVKLVYELRTQLLAQLVRLSPAFYETRSIGELLSRLTADLTTFQRTFTSYLPGGVQAVLSFAGSLLILLFLHLPLTLLTLTTVPVVIVLSLWFGSRLGKMTTRVQDALADTSAGVEETLAGLRTVQSFGREEQEVRGYQARLGQLLALQLENIRLTGAFSGLLQFSGCSAFAAVLWYGGWLVARRELTPGELTSFLLYTFWLAGSVGSLGSLYAHYRELQGATARVFELLELPPAISDPPTPVVLVQPQGKLTFAGVGFHYPAAPQRWAVQDIDLEVRPGEMVALVGPSGSGKTTLFSLLLRFFDPTVGSVRLDDHDLRTLRVADLRRVLAIVPQEIFLFRGTVEENLRIGNPAATADQLHAAAEAAGADSFIRALPNGYAEVVGERGVRLSAGQRQRVAIARALLKQPAVLLLDEATSALDAESEETVQRALAVLWSSRTTLVIAHRLATARRADRILVLDQGRIVGSGSHAHLYAANALYRRYWELQTATPMRPT